MFLAHSFRLRDPWQCERTDEGVRWSRLFHRPTGLEPDDELWLVISGLPPEAVVRVNGKSPLRGRNSVQSSGSLSLEGATSTVASGDRAQAVARAKHPAGEGDEPEANSNHPSLTLPIEGREPESSNASPHEYHVTHILRDSNQIEILVTTPYPLPTTDSSSFPYDARLGVVGHS